MPPVSQQSSRTGILASLIVSIIFAVVFIFLFMQERGNRQKAENNAAAVESRYLGGHYLPDVSADIPDRLKTARDKAQPQPGDEGKKQSNLVDADNAFDLVFGERQKLIEMFTGSSSYSASDAKNYLLAHRNAAKLAAAAVKLQGVDFALDPSTIVDQLVAAYATLAKQAEDASAAKDQESAKIAQLQKDRDELVTGQKAQIDAVQKLLQDKQAEYDKLKQDQQAALAQVTQSNTGNNDELNKQIKDLQGQIAALTPQIPPLQAKIKRLESTLKVFRMDPTDNIVRRADGAITRISEDNTTCVINLGLGDHITAGMTFEVYDQRVGIPSLKADIPALDDENAKRVKSANAKLAAAADKGTGGLAGAIAISHMGERYDTQLPSGGKGSIEVISPGPDHASICRIVVTEGGGAALHEGDLIANLVYDPHVKFKFGVYGNFDLDYNGIATLADTAVIKRLIQQWGGVVVPINSVEDITPDVDFLVMGITPKVHALPDNASPQDIDQQAKEQNGLKVFNDVMVRAREFSVPVLNQTRFLYYTGYFDQKTR